MHELGFKPQLSGPGPGSLMTTLCCAAFATKDKFKVNCGEEMEIFREISTN